MKLTDRLKAATTYEEIAQIIGKQLANVQDVQDVKFCSVKTDFCNKQGIAFHACLVSDERLFEGTTTHNVKKQLGELDLNRSQFVQGIDKVDKKNAFYVYLYLDATTVPLVLPLIENAHKVRNKQLKNWQIREQAEQKAKEFVSNDRVIRNATTEITRLKKELRDRKKALAKEAKQVEQDYYNDNQSVITKAEETLFIQAGEKLNCISLW